MGRAGLSSLGLLKMEEKMKLMEENWEEFSMQVRTC